MAEVYRYVRGKPIAEFMARIGAVQESLDEHAKARGAEAAALLEGRSMHRSSPSDPGHSRIVVEHWDVDHYVVLDDDAGLLAAWQIEFGRKKTNTPGLRPLRDAFPELKE